MSDAGRQWQMQALQAASADRILQRADACTEPELARLLRGIGQRHIARLLSENRPPQVGDPTPAQAAAVALDEPARLSDALLELEPVTDDLVIVRLPRPPDFVYRAGQSAKLEVGGVARRYSLASAPHEPQLEFFVELHPGGQMAAQLRTLSAQTPLSVGAVKGELGLAAGFSNHLMIATVTGISPYVSLLRERLREPDGRARFIVLHGASYQDEFGYADELRGMAAVRPQQVIYLPTVSRPEESRNHGWSGATGRVETLVDPVLTRYGLIPENTCLYACGHAQMVDGVERRYRQQGFEVRTEPY